MRIGIVLHPYGEDKPAGLGRAIFEITRNLIALDQKNEYVVFLRRRPKTLPQFSGNNWKLKIADYKYFWLDRALWGEDLDVCIFNTPITSFFIRPKKSIVIVYDFAYDDFGPNKMLKLYHRFSLKAADLIISISEATKKEAIRLFGLPEEKIKVVYLGFEKVCEFFPPPTPKLPEKYFLFVGVIKERKNVHGVVEAFYKFKKATSAPHKLIVAGWGKGKYFERVKSLIKDNNIILDTETRGERLSHLYKNAEALLFPSFVEGFGFPVLEAMSCGIPVITSNQSSLPEVAGEAALLVDPNNTDEMAEAMRKIAENPSLRPEIIRKGFEQIKKFSWQKTAKGYVDIIDKLR